MFWKRRGTVGLDRGFWARATADCDGVLRGPWQVFDPDGGRLPGEASDIAEAVKRARAAWPAYEERMRARDDRARHEQARFETGPREPGKGDAGKADSRETPTESDPWSGYKPWMPGHWSHRGGWRNW